MAADGQLSIEKLVNFSDGDVCLYLDFPGLNNALLFDAGDVYRLSQTEITDIAGIFFSHFHFDHFTAFDRVLRLNIDRDKTIVVVGPQGVTRAVRCKLEAYDYIWFPFMKLRLDVHEITDEKVTRTMFACADKFAPTPMPAPTFKGNVCFDSRECRVIFAHADHTVPCLSYAMETKRGYLLDTEKLASSALKLGPWVKRVIAEARKPRKERAEYIDIDGGEFELDALLKNCFTLAPKTRITYCTDSRLTPESRDRLLGLAHRSTRLYCDAYYLDEDRERAEKYGHMTALQAAQFARDAEANELVLVHFAPKYRHRFSQLLDEARTVFSNTHMILNGEKF